MGKKVTTIDFIVKSKIIHGDKYDYSLVKYVNVKTKIKIICEIHGEFELSPNKHLGKRGCQKCSITNMCKLISSNNEEFIKKAINIHGNKYNYDKIKYNGNGLKIEIICDKHGEFKQTPHNHLAGNGCPICRESKGEKEIKEFLIKNNINYTPQKRFINCRNILPLPFDFYLPDFNICIEYQGIQHFKPRSKFGGEKEFNKLLIRDNIKFNYCLNNKIELVTINYKDDILEKLLELPIYSKLPHKRLLS